MASDIHKKRTGKGFKISEEIVVKEEMYEEEEDDLHRQYRALAADLRTSSSDINYQPSAYPTNQEAIASLIRQQEVNRIFAEQFPNAARISQQLTQTAYHQTLQQETADASSRRTSMPSDPPSPSPHQSSVDTILSPPGLTSASGSSRSTGTPESHLTPTFTEAQTVADVPLSVTGLPIDLSGPIYLPGPVSSPLTAEQSAETELLPNIDMSNMLATVSLRGELVGSDGMCFTNYAKTVGTTLCDPVARISVATIPAVEENAPPPAAAAENYSCASLQPANKHFSLHSQRSTVGTPGGGAGDEWESWINTDQWTPVEMQTESQ